ncbi:sulfur carrier protein ThiS [Streptomyces bluensis]|uniref:sulfur carrier protein ThiS n=1 Tax=Streptomyces bluensis TaxID=33897 RepID=UPI00199FF972|nr:thiamine biosynthesis protein ThiS [Streptomyces bluensis]
MNDLGSGDPTGVHVFVNGERQRIAAGTALDTLVKSLTAAPSGVAAALNETVVPRAQWPSTPLSEGDRVEVLTAVQGG